ncbi:MAG: hypothetical protein QF476_01360 [Dehalococcoidia bacterium]|jgi:uncharacterized membrane protein|nr:hypothetical protein [Dehalococcoidia bacterium]
MNHLPPIPIKFHSNLPASRLLAIAIVGALALAFLFQSSELPVASAQNPPDRILGKVSNGTEGGVLPVDLRVILMSIDLANNQIIEQETTSVDEDGIFRFSNLVSRSGLDYRVIVNGGSYTPSVEMAAVENWQNVRINIYDETTSLDEVSVSSYVMMIPTIDARSRQLGVLTVIDVNNTGDEIWVPDITNPELSGLDLLRFNLPVGFTDLSIESELPTGNILEIDSGFALTNPVPPGEFAILISYILPYEGDNFDFNLKLPYGADQVRMLLPDEGGSVSADGFSTAKSIVVAERVFNQYEGDDYAAETDLVVGFSGLPQPTLGQTVSDFFDGRTYVIVIIWIVGVALLAIFGYAMYSSRKPSNRSDQDDYEMVARSEVVAEIAEIDQKYEDGSLGEDEYNQKREELKNFVLEFDEATTSLEQQPEESDEKLEDSSDDEDNTSEDTDK